jgi:uncharacterized protein YjbJ (UPF0337 family)
VKEVTVKIVGNSTLEKKGKSQKNIGKVQTGYGDLKSAWLKMLASIDTACSRGANC